MSATENLFEALDRVTGIPLTESDIQNLMEPHGFKEPMELSHDELKTLMYLGNYSRYGMVYVAFATKDGKIWHRLTPLS